MPAQTRRKAQTQSSDHKTAIKTGKSATHVSASAPTKQSSRGSSNARRSSVKRRSKRILSLQGHQLSDSHSSLLFHDGTKYPATPEGTQHGRPAASQTGHESAQDPLCDRGEDSTHMSSVRKVSEIFEMADEGPSTLDEDGHSDVIDWVAFISDMRVAPSNETHTENVQHLAMSNNIGSGSAPADSHLPTSSTTAADMQQHYDGTRFNNDSDSQNTNTWLLNTPLDETSQVGASSFSWQPSPLGGKKEHMYRYPPNVQIGETFVSGTHTPQGTSGNDSPQV